MTVFSDMQATLPYAEEAQEANCNGSVPKA